MGGAGDSGHRYFYGHAGFLDCEYQSADDCALFSGAFEWRDRVGDYCVPRDHRGRAADNWAPGGYDRAEDSLGGRLNSLYDRLGALRRLSYTAHLNYRSRVPGIGRRADYVRRT